MEDEFALACRAFAHFTLAERHRALATFVTLDYPVIADRWFEAIHRVVCEIDRDAARADPRQPGGDRPC